MSIVGMNNRSNAAALRVLFRLGVPAALAVLSTGCSVPEVGPTRQCFGNSGSSFRGADAGDRVTRPRDGLSFGDSFSICLEPGTSYELQLAGPSLVSGLLRNRADSATLSVRVSTFSGANFLEEVIAPGGQVAPVWAYLASPEEGVSFRVSLPSNASRFAQFDLESFSSSLRETSPAGASFETAAPLRRREVPGAPPEGTPLILDVGPYEGLTLNPAACTAPLGAAKRFYALEVDAGSWILEPRGLDNRIPHRFVVRTTDGGVVQSMESDAGSSLGESRRVSFTVPDRSRLVIGFEHRNDSIGICGREGMPTPSLLDVLSYEVFQPF